MARDVNLLLEAAETLTSTTTKAAKDTEGGFYGIVSVGFGAITGTTPTDDMTIEASINGGTNYFPIARFPQIIGTSDNLQIARPVYIPRPASGQVVTKVRIVHTIAGTTPSFAITGVFLEPMVSLGAPAIDEVLAQGIAALI